MAPIVALHERDTVALGSLQERGYVTGDLLVTSRDLAGESWWVPAESVWVDADAIGHPEHPRATGLATAINRDQAVLTGLSDRLGWEAVSSSSAAPTSPRPWRWPRRSPTTWWYSTGAWDTTSRP